MIPKFDPATGNLPPGIHEATWREFSERFGSSPRRRELMAGLRRALDNLEVAGCRRVYIDGSFVTQKKYPDDFDGCWELEGVKMELLDPALCEVDPPRPAQRAKYGGELFPIDSNAIAFSGMLRFFQRDSETGKPKGIVAVNLGQEEKQ